MCYNIVENKRRGRIQMEKSMYSVILRDDLVGELDRLAFKNGVSRSVMLNKILSEYLDVETPEAQMERMFLKMEQFIGAVSGLRFINNASLAMAQVQSALHYRYNPTLRYQVELFPAGNLGQLKISLRSQSKELFRAMEGFYALFISLEKKYIGERAYFYQDGRFVRVFVRPENAGAEELGEAIGEFVREFDEYLNCYLSCDEAVAAAVVEKAFVKNLKTKKVIL